MHGGIRLCGCLGRSFTQPKLSCVSPELTALPVTVSNISRTVRFTTAWPPSVLYDSRIWRAAPGKRVAGARAASHVSASQGQVTPETRTAAADCILKTIMANARPFIMQAEDPSCLAGNMPTSPAWTVAEYTWCKVPARSRSLVGRVPRHTGIADPCHLVQDISASGRSSPCSLP